MSGIGHNGNRGSGAGVVVVAASYGGLAAYRTLLAGLPAEFPWPILLVQHRSPQSDYLAPILARSTELRVVPAREAELLQPWTVYVLPAERQVVLEHDRRLVFRPAARCRADPLLESVASAVGERAIAAVLTGRGSDGSAGVRAIKSRGGRVLVQDDASAAAFAMPAAAIATGCVDFVLPLRSIAAALVSLVMVPGAAELFRVRLSPWASAASR
jgi:two-component system chemotaxis response regulator CheB